MLPFHMIDAQHPRRTSDSFSGPAPILRPQFGPACPDPVVGLAVERDNILTSQPITFSPTLRPHKPFRCNTYGSRRKCWALLTSWAQFSLQGVDKERLTVFSDGRRDDGRSRTCGFCWGGGASSPAGFAALPHAFQQTSVHPAAVAGGAVPDALRRLDLSRSRGTLARAPRVARRIALASGARLHHAVSFSAASGGRHRRSRIAGNRAAAAATPESACFCRHRRHRALRYFRQHLLPPAPGAACPRDQASSSLVEVVDCGGCAATDFVGAAGSSRARVRRARPAGVARCGGTRRSPRCGAGGVGGWLRSPPPAH